jgi:motility quorum-sensing regulator/GCU-specific mRNA interferase toxin
MEKRTPHYRLAAIQSAVAERGIDCFTRTAQDGAAAMGLTATDAMQTVLQLVQSDFSKSMTTYADHRVWQDVYHARTPQGIAYVKLTARDDGSVVISFKEL